MKLPNKYRPSDVSKKYRIRYRLETGRGESYNWHSRVRWYPVGWRLNRQTLGRIFSRLHYLARHAPKPIQLKYKRVYNLFEEKYFATKGKASMRYGEYFGGVNLIYPTTFDISTPSDYLAIIAEGIKAGVPPAVTYSNVYNYIKAIHLPEDESTILGSTANTNIKMGGNMTVSAGGVLGFNTNGSERARIDSSGRLLVGTSTSPTVGDAQYGLLRTQGNTSTSSGFGLLSIARGLAPASITSGAEIGYIHFTANDGSPFARIECSADANAGVNDYPGRLVFSTCPDGSATPVERLRIQANGDVFINKTTTDDTVTGFRYGSNRINVTNAGLCAFINRQGSDGSVINFARSNVDVGSISVTTTATAYNTSSDYRLKENVFPLTGAIDRVNQLQVHRFNFIADPDKTVDGFIAHEAQVIVPECVTGTKDEVDDEGNPIYQGIDQSKLVPLLTAALQALAEIESLRARLDAAGI